MGSRGKRLVIVAAMALAAVNLFTGAPLLAVWLGSQVQGASGRLSMGAVVVVLLVLTLLCGVLVWTLGRLGAAHDALVGRERAVRQAPWMRAFNTRPAHARSEPLGALDTILVTVVVLALLAFETWFLFFAGSPIG